MVVGKYMIGFNKFDMPHHPKATDNKVPILGSMGGFAFCIYWYIHPNLLDSLKKLLHHYNIRLIGLTLKSKVTNWQNKLGHIR